MVEKDLHIFLDLEYSQREVLMAVTEVVEVMLLLEERETYGHYFI